AENPAVDRTRTAKRATRDRIAADRRRLKALGVDVAWNIGTLRFETPIETDLGVMIGGNFAPDHLGPNVYEAIRKRATAQPKQYLATLERIVGTAPEIGWLSSTYVASVIDLLRSAPAAA